jgi:alanine racemase
MTKYSVNKIVRLVEGKLRQKTGSTPEISELLIDSRKIINPSLACFFALKGESRDGHKYLREAYNKGVRCFILSDRLDNIELEDAVLIEVENTLVALQKLCKAHRDQFDFPVLAITGSNGKTIVKEWLAQLLKEEIQVVKSPKSYNSQVGVPLSLWQCNERHELGIFEAGISKVGEMVELEKMISPDIGLITNIGTAHCENFQDKREKAKEKFLLFKNSKNVIYNKDGIEVSSQISSLSKTVNLFSWSKSQEADLKISEIRTNDVSTTIKGIFLNNQSSIKIPFIDQASIENAIHCWAVLLCLEKGTEVVMNRFENLSAVAMRLELKDGINNCSLVNDYYNSDLVSLEIAVSFIEHQKRHKKKTLILSDILESGEEPSLLYERINQVIVSKGISKIIGVGESISAHASCFKLEKQFYADTASFLTQHDFNLFSDETILLKGARQFSFEKISEILQKQVHNTVLEVSLSAVQHNLNYFKSKLKSNVKVMAMVKAHSYGAGAFEVANLLQFNKIDYLGVAYADEGIALREAGISTPIMVLNPDLHVFEKMIKYHLEPEIFNFRTLELFEKAVIKENLTDPYPIHLKIDTGMHRLGFSIHEVPVLIDLVNKNKDFRLASVFSHLATSDDLQEMQHTMKQVKDFFEIKKMIEGAFATAPLFHLLNSAGILTLHEAQFDMVRLGLGLYGISPLTNFSKYLHAVSSLKTRISQIRDVGAGEAIGYGRAGVLSHDSEVATIPIGYADGLRRSLGNGKGYVIIGGKRASIIGNVCMDMCMVDVTGINAEEGDEVIVFGEGLSIDVFAKNMKTIPYEALTGISPRVKRVYFQE